MMRVSAGRPDIQTNDMDVRGGDREASFESGTHGAVGYSSIEEMDPSLGSFVSIDSHLKKIYIWVITSPPSSS